jgi:hypothetical protein
LAVLRYDNRFQVIASEIIPIAGKLAFSVCL